VRRHPAVRTGLALDSLARLWRLVRVRSLCELACYLTAT